MMSQELRLGNYVSDDCGNIYIVRSIKEKGNVSISKTKTSTSIDYKIIDLHPISINAEWLLNYCFLKNNSWFIKTLMPSASKNMIDLRINLKSYSVCVYGDKLLEPSYLKECKYIHQLQNLFFSLTGEELTIKS